MRAVKYLLVDGNNLAFRCFYGIQQLSNATMPVNAIYGFINSLLSLGQQIRYEYLIVCFDCGRSTQRIQLLETYKANRSSTPDAFKQQLPYIKQCIPLLGGLCCEQQGIEADDLIGAWVAFAEEQQSSVAIMSADKDMMQLVSDSILQLVPNGQAWIEFYPQNVFAKTGVYPNQMVDYLALIGDSADNYPGISGVGPKTAANWLQQYGSIEAIYENIVKIKPQRFQALLSESKSLLEKNRQLAKLDSSLEHIQDWIPLLPTLKKDTDALIALLQRLNLNKLAKKLQNDSNSRTNQTEFAF